MKKKQLRKFLLTEIKLSQGITNVIAIAKNNIINLDASPEVYEENPITMNENPFIHMIEKMSDNRFDNNFNFNWILKITFPSTDTALKAINYTIVYNGSLYDLWISTPSDMKNNRAIYVRREFIHLIEEFEKITSCGKITSSLFGQEVCINKDITARLSLFLSSSYPTTITPNFLVLPEKEYKTLCKIKTFESINSDKLTTEENDLKSIFADGCGLAHPDMMKRISKKIGLDYTPCFVGIRSIKLATKGILASVDFIKYFYDMYMGDTEYFRKGNDGYFYALDIYNKWIKIDTNTIIVNESMCKWSKNFNSIADYELKRPVEYAPIMDSLFITKFSSKEPDTIKKTSYQLLSQLALTRQELSSLTTPTYNLLYGVYNNKKEFIYRYLKCATVENIEDITNETNYSIKESNIKIANKLIYLLTKDFDRFIKMPFVKKELSYMINRSISELGSGKFFVRGNFKTIVNEPLGILNFVMTREINGSLSNNEFWCNTDEKEVLACRYPIASFSEIKKMNFVDNELYSKYCSHWSSELCVFNAVDITAKLLSGADYDGDMIFTSPEKELIDSIIEPQDGIHFISTIVEKITPKKTAYSWSNRIYENMAYSGNLIGEVATLNTSISNMAQNLGAFMNETNVTIKDIYYNNYFSLTSTLNDFWAWYNKLPQTIYQSPEVIKSEIKRQFYNLQNKIYKTVEISMLAIDSPKTGQKPNLDYIFALKKEFKKPYFTLLLPDKSSTPYSVDRLFDNSALSSYSRYCEHYLLRWNKEKLKKCNYGNCESFRELFEKANFLSTESDKVTEAQQLLFEAFKSYESERQKRDKKRSVYLQVTDELTGEVYEDTSIVVARELIHNEETRKLFNKKLTTMGMMDSLNIKESFDIETICKAIAHLLTSNHSNLQKFIYSYYFYAIEYMCNLQYEENEILIQSPEGIEILYNTYKLAKLPNDHFKSNIAEMEIVKFTQNIVFDTPIKIRCSRLTDISAINHLLINIVPEESSVYLSTPDGINIGKVFADNTMLNGKANLFTMHSMKLIISPNIKVNDKSYGFEVLEIVM